MLFSQSDQQHQPHPAQWAFRLHRLSGLVLALYLPVHFFYLADVIAAADNIAVSDPIRAKLGIVFAEVALVFFLTAHVAGGLRVLLIRSQFVQRHQGPWLVSTVVVAICVSGAFLWSAMPDPG